MDAIDIVFSTVRKLGTLTNKAQSCWGADRWEHNGIAAMLEDDGYTQHIRWGDRLECYQTAGRKIEYKLGNEKDLNILAQGLTEPYYMV